MPSSIVILTLLGCAPVAEAEVEPTYIDAMLQQVRGARTGLLFIRSNVARGTLSLWFDRRERHLKVVGPSNGQLHVDDSSTSLQMEFAGEMVSNEVVDALYRPTFDDLMGDLTGLRFTQVGTTTRDSTCSPECRVYSVDFAGAWDDGLGLHLAVNPEGGVVGGYSEVDGESRYLRGVRDRIVPEYPAWHGVSLVFNAPIPPEAYNSAYTSEPAFAGFHGHGGPPDPYRDYLSFAYRQSYVKAELQGTSLGHASWSGCTAGESVESTAVATWSFSAQDKARIAQALQSCPDVRFEARPYAIGAGPEGVTSCLSGIFHLKNAATGEVLRQVPVSGCDIGNWNPSLVLPLEWPSPPLEVSFQGVTRLTCITDNTGYATATVGMWEGHPPFVSWFGCYPDWDFTMPEP